MSIRLEHWERISITDATKASERRVVSYSSARRRACARPSNRSVKGVHLADERLANLPATMQHTTRPATPYFASIPPQLYERLRRVDEAHGARDAPIFTWYAHYAKASQWVGVVQLDGLQLELLPKIHDDDADRPAADARAALVTMLAYAGDVPLRLRDLASLLERNADLGEVLAAMFAERLVEELARGPERNYVMRRENLTTFRGKLAVRKHLALNAAHRERFLCDHDELVSDTALNQVLRAACVLLAGTVRARRTGDLLARCLAVLDDVADIVVTATILERVAITRQNERFAPLLAFCRMLFAGRAPTAQSGPTRTFSLLFDMNAVFERFVAGFIAREVLPLLPAGWKSHSQARGHTRHLLLSAGRGVLRLAPDLLLERPDGSLLVIDTKWKRLTPGAERRSVSRADLYQLYAYGQRFQATRSVLLYPHVEGVVPERFDVLGDDDVISESRIDVRYLRVHGLQSRPARDVLADQLARELSS